MYQFALLVQSQLLHTDFYLYFEYRIRNHEKSKYNLALLDNILNSNHTANSQDI